MNNTEIALSTVILSFRGSGKGGKKLRIEQWKELELFYHRGHAKAIGVSHFCKQHVEELLEISTVKIAVNQVQVRSKFFENRSIMGLQVNAPFLVR